VVEAYETVVPKSSRVRLRKALHSARTRPNVVTFTSSSTVKNFVSLLGAGSRRSRRRPRYLEGVKLASIGPVTTATLHGLHLGVDLEAKQYTIPGLIAAIVDGVRRA
jgi:uroporphyrinogen-III synthase